VIPVPAKSNDAVADATPNGPLAVNPDPNDIEGDGLYNAGESVEYTLRKLSSLIGLDAVTTAHGFTTVSSTSRNKR